VASPDVPAVPPQSRNRNQNNNMNHFKKKSFPSSLLAVCCLIGLVCALALPALAQVSSLNIAGATNLPAIINAATVSNITSVIPIFRNSGVALQVRFNASAGTANNIIYIVPQVDGTNDCTAPLWVWSIPANGTTDVIASTNWSPHVLSGYSGLSIKQWTNAHATAVTTNKGIVMNRWYPNGW
jgi:hypothetical protein